MLELVPYKITTKYWKKRNKKWKNDDFEMGTKCQFEQQARSETAYIKNAPQSRVTRLHVLSHVSVTLERREKKRRKWKINSN